MACKSLNLPLAPGGRSSSAWAHSAHFPQRLSEDLGTAYKPLFWPLYTENMRSLILILTG